MHEGIGALLYFEVGDLAGTAVPECFRAIGHADAFEGQVVYFAEGFRRIDEAVEEPQIAAVPERRTVGGCEIAVAAGDVLALPDDVHAFESAFDGFDTTRLFESRLTFANSDAVQLEIAGGV